MKLQIHQAKKEDMFTSVIRLHRKKVEKLKLKVHKVVRVNNKEIGKVVYAHLRTIDDDREIKWIRMDEDLRNKLKVSQGMDVELKIENTGLIGLLIYCLTHSNPTIKYPSWIAFLLGILSIGISITSWLMYYIN